jgi:hypothetical protein
MINPEKKTEYQKQSTPFLPTLPAVELKNFLYFSRFGSYSARGKG